MIFKLELSPEEVNLIAAALGKQPFEAVASLMGKLQLQVREQENAPKLEAVPKESA